MPSISLPTGSYSLPEPRAASRRLINCFSEASPTYGSLDSKDKDTPVILRRSPGIQTFASFSTGGPVRGMWMMEGLLYAVVGQYLYSVSSSGITTQLGSGITGTGRVHISDNSACLVIILPGTNVGYTYTTTGGAFAQITDPNFLAFGALNLAFIDTYIVFLALNGREFYNSDSQIVSGLGPISFTNFAPFPREFGTDLFVGMSINQRNIFMMGQLTSEVFIDVGNALGSPFASAPNNFMEMGCACGESIAKQDQSIFWLANDRTIRRLTGQTPVRVSNHGIESILEQAFVGDAYAITYSIGGHLFYALTMPTTQRTLVYDCTTTEWHELSSFGLGYWRPYCSISAYGFWMVGDSLSSTIGQLNTSIFTEFGNPLTATWQHQPVYSGHNRIRHKRLEAILGTGQSPITGQGSNPLLTLQVSDDGGNSFRTFPTRTLGVTGQRQMRAVWYNLGMSRDRVYQFNLSDPVELWTTDVQLETDLALH